MGGERASSTPSPEVERSLVARIQSGADTIMAMKAEGF